MTKSSLTLVSILLPPQQTMKLKHKLNILLILSNLQHVPVCPPSVCRLVTTSQPKYFPPFFSNNLPPLLRLVLFLHDDGAQVFPRIFPLLMEIRELVELNFDIECFLQIFACNSDNENHKIISFSTNTKSRLTPQQTRACLCPNTNWTMQNKI